MKTRAQVNEVLDDRAVIKKLQKELDEARLLAGGNKAIKKVKELEMKCNKDAAEIQAKTEQLAAAEEKAKRITAFFIKGGTVFQQADNAHPSLKTPGKVKVNRRRQTVAPKAGFSSSLLSPGDTPPRKMDARRKSVGTALTLRGANNASSMFASPAAPRMASALAASACAFVSLHESNATSGGMAPA